MIFKKNCIVLLHYISVEFNENKTDYEVCFIHTTKKDTKLFFMYYKITIGQWFMWLYLLSLGQLVDYRSTAQRR